MKLFVKLMLFIVVAALAAPFILKGPDGRPLMSLDMLKAPDVKLPDFSKAADAVSASLNKAGEEPSKAVAVYKWQDENGSWHFSDNVEQGQSAQKLNVDPNANLVHYEGAGESRAQDEHDAQSGSPLGAVGTLIGDAKNVGHLQEEHLARQERALQQ